MDNFVLVQFIVFTNILTIRTQSIMKMILSDMFYPLLEFFHIQYSFVTCHLVSFGRNFESLWILLDIIVHIIVTIRASTVNRIRETLHTIRIDILFLPGLIWPFNNVHLNVLMLLYFHFCCWLCLHLCTTLSNFQCEWLDFLAQLN